MKDRRKRKQPATRGGEATLHMHERLARDIGPQAVVAVIEIDDPHATKPGEKINVLRQLRSDPLARLHSHRQIDEAQYRAGRAFQRDWETAERGTRALDPTHERVDGGVRADPFSDRQLRAKKRLVAIEQVLGRTMHRVTRAVLVEGMSMESTAQHLFNRQGEAAAKYVGQLFRDGLDVLAGEYGLAGR